MKNGRKWTALALCLALLTTPALAGVEEDTSAAPEGEALVAVPYSPRAGAAKPASLLPVVNTYPGFDDVAADTWYYQGVVTCYEAGLMMGTDKGYQPEMMLSVGQTATIAARLREILTGEHIPMATPKPGETLPWYFSYVEYMRKAAPELDPLLSVPEEPISRRGYFLLLNAAVPQNADLLEPINAISVLPDTDEDRVLRFYNAGILTGTDEYGTFEGDRTLTRQECAVMAARLADPAQRKEFTPKPKATPSQSPSAPSAEPTAAPSASPSANPSASPAASPSPSATPEPSAVPSVSPSPSPSPAPEGVTVMTVNGVDVDRTTFIQILDGLIYNLDNSIYQRSHTRLDWNHDYGVGDLKVFFLDQAIENAIRYTILETQAANYGCEITDLPAKLNPDPDYDTLSAYAREHDYLCAKHILVDDLETAKAVLDGLNAVPTMDQFQALMAVFTTDPGSKTSPDGYLFTAGDMVPQFEAATRELAVGAYTTEPVASQFGYHIIWRLDPATHPQLPPQYQYDMALKKLDVWAEQAKVTRNDDLIFQIDPKACYEAFLG